VKVLVRTEGAKVLVAVDDRQFLEIGWREADQLGRTILAKAREAEQLEEVEQLILDQGLLLRAGFPLSLTNNPRVLDAAKNEAAHNRTFRRAIQKSIRSTEVVGMPTLVQKPPIK
jgi:hypothetical protein